MKKIAVHNGKFHLDDLMAIAIIKAANFRDNFEIERTRNRQIIDDSDFAVDVGEVYDPERNRFDHHQNDPNLIRENGFKYAASGLVWKKFGNKIIKSVINTLNFSIGMKNNTLPTNEAKNFLIFDNNEIDKMCNTIDEKLILLIDRYDNGEVTDLPIDSLQLTNFIRILNLTATETESLSVSNKEYAERGKFDKALSIVETFLNSYIFSIINSFVYKKKIDEILSRDRENKNILVLDEPLGWIKGVLDYNEGKSVKEKIKFVIFTAKTGEYRVQCVPVNKEEAYSKLVPFPKEWGGLRDNELIEKVGRDDVLFCHANLFIAGCKTLETAIFIAEKVLQLEDLPTYKVKRSTFPKNPSPTEMINAILEQKKTSKIDWSNFSKSTPIPVEIISYFIEDFEALKNEVTVNHNSFKERKPEYKYLVDSVDEGVITRKEIETLSTLMEDERTIRFLLSLYNGFTKKRVLDNCKVARTINSLAKIATAFSNDKDTLEMVDDLAKKVLLILKDTLVRNSNRELFMFFFKTGIFSFPLSYVSNGKFLKENFPNWEGLEKTFNDLVSIEDFLEKIKTSLSTSADISGLSSIVRPSDEHLTDILYGLFRLNKVVPERTKRTLNTIIYRILDTSSLKKWQKFKFTSDEKLGYILENPTSSLMTNKALIPFLEKETVYYFISTNYRRKKDEETLSKNGVLDDMDEEGSLEFLEETFFILDDMETVNYVFNKFYDEFKTKEISIEKTLTVDELTLILESIDTDLDLSKLIIPDEVWMCTPPHFITNTIPIPAYHNAPKEFFNTKTFKKLSLDTKVRFLISNENDIPESEKEKIFKSGSWGWLSTIFNPEFKFSFKNLEREANPCISSREKVLKIFEPEERVTWTEYMDRYGKENINDTFWLINCMPKIIKRMKLNSK